MSSSTIDRHFRRFRDEGDVSALAEVFDEVAPEMLRVARHLASASIEPHDLIQNTFLVAIQRAEAYDPERPVKQWLLGILAKEAAYQRRRGSRVVEPDRLDEHRALDPLELAEDQEFSSALTKALDELPEKYQEVVRPVLLEGQNPRDVARTVGQRPGTVRVQLHRGLRLLRDALPAGFALGAVATMRSPGMAAPGLASAGASGATASGLALVRTRILLEGAGRDGAVVAAGSSVAGGWLAARLRIAALGVLAVGLGGLAYFGSRSTAGEADLAQPEFTRSEAVAGVPELALGGREPVLTAAVPIGDSSEASGSMATVQVTGRVLGLDCQPAVDAAVELDVAGAGRFKGRTNAAGDFRIAAVVGGSGTWPGTVRVATAPDEAHARAFTLRSDAREAYLGSFVMDEAMPISVRVEGDRGEPIAGAEVTLLGSGGALQLGRGTSGVGGLAEFPAVPRGRLEVRARLGGLAAVRGVGARRRQEPVALRLLEVEPGRTDDDGGSSEPRQPEPRQPEPGLPNPDAILRLSSPAGPVWNPGSGFLSANVPLEYRANTDGEVEVSFPGVEPGSSVLLNLEADGFRPQTQRVTLREAGLPNPVDIRLDPHATLFASILRDPDVRVELELQRFAPGVGGFGPTGLDFGGMLKPNTPEGDFRFDGLVPGTYRLRERLSDLCSEPIEVLAGAQTVRVELDLTVLVRVSGRVVVPDPDQIRKVSILVESEGVDEQPNRWTPLQRFQLTTRPRSDGRFSLLVPSDRDVRISAYHPLFAPSATRGAVEFTSEQPPGSQPGELVLELVQGDELTLALHGLSAKHALDRLRVLLYPDGTIPGGTTPGGKGSEPVARLFPRVEAGAARFAGVPQGRWTLWIDPGAKTGVQPALVHGVEVVPGRSLQLPEPDFVPGGRIVLSLNGSLAAVGTQDSNATRLTLFARSRGEPKYVRTATAVGGEPLQLDGLGPGGFTVWVQSPAAPGPLLERELNLAPGERVELTLAPR